MYEMVAVLIVLTYFYRKYYGEEITFIQILILWIKRQMGKRRLANEHDDTPGMLPCLLILILSDLLYEKSLNE
jgi:hypothetical protein